MINSPGSYQPQTSDLSLGLKLRKTDLLQVEESQEHSVALKIISIILDSWSNLRNQMSVWLITPRWMLSLRGLRTGVSEPCSVPAVACPFM